MNSTASHRTVGSRLTEGMRTGLHLVRVPVAMFLVIAATVGFVAGPIPAVLERFAQVYVETGDHCRFYDRAFLNVNTDRDFGGTTYVAVNDAGRCRFEEAPPGWVYVQGGLLMNIGEDGIATGSKWENVEGISGVARTALSVLLSASSVLMGLGLFLLLVYIPRVFILISDGLPRPKSPALGPGGAADQARDQP